MSIHFTSSYFTFSESIFLGLLGISVEASRKFRLITIFVTVTVNDINVSNLGLVLPCNFYAGSNQTLLYRIPTIIVSCTNPAKWTGFGRYNR